MSIQNFLNVIDLFCESQEIKEEDDEKKCNIKNIRNILNLRNINNDINHNNKIISNIVGYNGLSNVMSFFLTNYMNKKESVQENFVYFCECTGEIQKNRSECVICIENIKDFDKVMVTECNHVFHVDCIMKWIKNTKTCPTCRQEIRLE